jgi:hypothetical protein
VDSCHEIDGRKQTFGYDSALWSNKLTLNEDSLEIDDDEAKFASYWTVPFTKIRVGMKVQGSTEWITIQQAASSLYSLIADGQYRSTNVGKCVWRSLLPRTSLQHHCNKEGFNTRAPKTVCSMVRLGLISNEGNHCHTPDSFLGFGTSYENRGISTSVGNYAEERTSADNGNSNIQAIGYIMVR